MKSSVFILRIFQTLFLVVGFNFAATLSVAPEQGMIQIKSVMIAYAISLIANLLQRNKGNLVLLVCSLGLIATGVAQELGYLSMSWEFSKLIQDTTVKLAIYPAILLAIIDWMSFTTIVESRKDTKAISADERVALMLQANTRADR